MPIKNATEESRLRQDERRHERFEGRLEAYLLVDGAPWRCWIRDISIGGAGLEPEMPAALGKSVVLSSPHFDVGMPLKGHVINVADKRTCISFDLDPTIGERLMRILADANH
jgi:PilZ domain